MLIPLFGIHVYVFGSVFVFVFEDDFMVFKCYNVLSKTQNQTDFPELTWVFVVIIKIFWRKWQHTPVLLPEKSHGRRSLVWATVHGVTKSRAWLSDFIFTFTFWINNHIFSLLVKKKKNYKQCQKGKDWLISLLVCNKILLLLFS